MGKFLFCDENQELTIANREFFIEQAQSKIEICGSHANLFNRCAVKFGLNKLSEDDIEKIEDMQFFAIYAFVELLKSMNRLNKDVSFYIGQIKFLFLEIDITKRCEEYGINIDEIISAKTQMTTLNTECELSQTASK